MNTPYLIQRATIKRPLAQYKDCRLSGAVNFDYMGSAEFEFGAVPAAFQQLKNNDIKEAVILSIVNDKEQPLRVLHILSTEDLTTYVQYLHEMREGKNKFYLKESLRDFNITNSKSGIDFWWDIVNGVMWSFDKVFMKNLPNQLNASFEVMNKVEQK